MTEDRKILPEVPAASRGAAAEDPLARTRLLLGEDGLERLRAAKVILVGLGGVGGACGEALARSGVGEMLLIDGDIVCPSNMNRQLIAERRTIGRPKADVMAERLAAVSDARVTAVRGRLTPENAGDLLPDGADYIVDAVDDVPAKAAIAVWAREHSVPVLSCMGTGNRIDPGRLRVSDAFLVTGDPLARKLRSLLRKKGIGSLPAVFSDEPPTRDPGQTAIGSFMPVTASAGLLAAAKVITDLLRGSGKEKTGGKAMGYRETYEVWLAEERVDEASKAELRAAAADEKELEDRFYRELEFGTAGLRGILGAGTNRMNVYVVGRATQGLAEYVLEHPGGAERGVAIAYDSRHMSKEFAGITAGVLAANGIRSFLFDRLHPVPMLSFMLMHKNCIAGVVITASHNPSAYNGYKVYWENGAQCAPEQASAILDRINAVPYFTEKKMPLEEAVAGGLVTMLGEDEDEAYYREAEKLMLYPELVREKGAGLPIVYTPLNGTGAVPVKKLLNRVGITRVDLVPEQAEPDGDFPTLKAPNPEDPNAFLLGEALAEKTGATVILATDPDADRMGIAVKRGDGSWQTLTGNQIGALLLYHILSGRKERGTLPENGVAVKSIVSGAMADAVAEAFGVEMERVLTGFRFIGEKIAAYGATGEKTFLFGFEESYGFLAGTFARDKDAVSSAMLAAEMCVKAAEEGKTLADKLSEMYERFGFYQEKVTSYTLAGKEGLERIASAMACLRADPVKELGGTPVCRFEDYRAGTARTESGEEKLILPNTNMLRFVLPDGAWVVVRPSGTEPKLKLYVSAGTRTKEGTEKRLGALFGDMDAVLKGYLGI